MVVALVKGAMVKGHEINSEDDEVEGETKLNKFN